MSRRAVIVLGAALAAVAAAVRFHGLDWGLPWALHIDERLFVVAKAIQLERSLAEGGIPDPGISSYGALPLWLLVAARALFLGAVTGGDAPVHGDEFAGTVLLSRMLSAVWGLATVGFIAAWASRWGRAAAWFAACLAAGYPALVQASHFGTVEAPLVALIAAGMLAIERAAAPPPGAGAAARRWIVAGAVIGLAVSVKAPGVILVLPLLHAAVPGRDARSVAVRLAPALVVALAVAVLINPTWILGAGSAGAGEHTTLGGNLRRAFSGDFHDWTLPYADDIPVWTELTELFPYALGPLGMALGLGGLVLFALRRRQPAAVRLLLVAVPLLLLLFAARVKTVRFLLPALPALAVLGGVGAARLLARIPAGRAPAAAALALLAVLPGIAFTAIYAGPDARVAAAHWLDENVGEREIVVVEDPPGYGPPLGSPTPRVPRAPLRYEVLWRDFYNTHEKLDGEGRRRHIGKTLRRATWLVLSEGHRVEFTTSPELRPVESAFYRELDEGRGGFEFVRDFKSYPRLGPWILRDDGAEVLFRVFDHPRIEVWKRSDAS